MKVPGRIQTYLNPSLGLTLTFRGSEKYQTPTTIKISATTAMTTNFMLLGSFGAVRDQ